MGTLGPRRYSRSIWRSYVAEVRRIGLFEQLAIIGALRGRATVRELGYQNIKGGGFKAVLEPIIHLSLSILGASPGSLFSRAQPMASVVSQGIEMKWTSSGKDSGTIRLRCDDPVKELSWVAWEGVSLYICEWRARWAPSRPRGPPPTAGAAKSTSAGSRK